MNTPMAAPVNERSSAMMRTSVAGACKALAAKACAGAGADAGSGKSSGMDNYRGVDVGNVMLSVTAERDCPANSAFVLSTPNLIEFVQADWAWADDDGSVLSRVSNKDSFEAYFYKDHELATDQRNAHALISDLQES